MSRTLLLCLLAPRLVSAAVGLLVAGSAGLAPALLLGWAASWLLLAGCARGR